MSKERWEYRGQWIEQESGRSGWYRHWYDPEKRQTRRRKLEAKDFQSAQEELIALFSLSKTTALSPSNVSLAKVLDHYITNKSKLQSKSSFMNARRAAQLCLLSIDTICAHAKVSDLTRLNQRKMWDWLHQEKKLKPKSISTNMILVRAAVRYAAIPQIVVINGEETEIQLLDNPVTIFCNEDEIAREVGGQISQPRQWVPKYEELGRWFNHIEHEDDFRYAIIAMNTWARNSAIFSLTLDQVDFDNGIIDLNPPGRRQTKKNRPIIRLTKNLAGWLREWGDHRPIRQYQDTVEKRINNIGKLIKDPNQLPDMTCYVFRHFMATQVRRSSAPVSREQRSLWLGHKIKEGSDTTEWYEKFDPDYLDGPMRATDEIIEKLNKFTTRSLFASAVRPQSGFTVIQGKK